MNTNILDTSALVLAVGGAVTLVVELAKRLGLAGDDDNSGARVRVALLCGAILTVLYAVSYGLLSVGNLFGLVSAWLVVTATGAGIHSAITASARTPGA